MLKTLNINAGSEKFLNKLPHLSPQRAKLPRSVSHFVPMNFRFHPYLVVLNELKKGTNDQLREHTFPFEVSRHLIEL